MLSEFPFDPVSGNDAAWLRLDRPTNHMVITAMAITETIAPARFIELIEQRFAHLPRFCCRPVLHSGVYFWERMDAIDLAAHIRCERLPTGAGKPELEAFVSSLQNKPLAAERPLWEFILLQGYGDQSVAIMRVHHCYADGLALISIFGALTDEHPYGTPATRSGRHSKSTADHAGLAAAARRRTAESIKAGLEAVSHGVERVTQLNFRLSPERYRWLKAETIEGRGLQLLNSAAEFARLAALPRDPETVMSQALGEQKRALWSSQLPLDDFKIVARQFGSSVNDVLLSCVAGGLGKYLAERQGVDDTLELRAAVPVNLRPACPPQQDERAGARSHIESDDDDLLGNQFGTIFIPLAVGLRNRVERLYKTKHDMRALKGSVQPVLSHIVIGAAGLLPTVLQQPLMDAFSNKTSLVLSNVPGSREQRFIAGSAVNELMFWVPQGGETGLGISLLSYNGHVQIGLLCDPHCVAAPQQLLSAICSELAEYLAT